MPMVTDKSNMLMSIYCHIMLCFNRPLHIRVFIIVAVYQPQL